MPNRRKVVELLRSPILLAFAALLVGIAIVWDGAPARAMNGLGGILWVASALAMATALVSDHRRLRLGVLVLALALLFAVGVRPSDGFIAVVAFGLGGAVIAAVGRPRAIAWSVMLPAIWLPVHLAVAVARAGYVVVTGGEATVRTEPPPTTAVVPLLMVVAAWAGALLVERAVQLRGSTGSAAIERA